MNNFIAIYLDNFTFNHNIIYFDKNGNEIPLHKASLEEIPALVLEDCHSLCVNDIKIMGSFIYGPQIKNAIQEEEIKIYSKNKINIEVI